MLKIKGGFKQFLKMLHDKDETFFNVWTHYSGSRGWAGRTDDEVAIATIDEMAIIANEMLND